MSNLFGEDDVTDPEEELSTTSHDQEDLSLIGHQAPLAQCKAWFDAGIMPHGLVLHGAKGIGKRRLALHLSALLLGQNNIYRIHHGGHSDILALARDMDERKGQLKADLPVATIRKIPNFIRQTPAEGGWRVVVIDDADHMNRSAQNALLKSLEEPPKDTCIILVVHQLGRLIPTIRSRVRCMAISPLPSSDVNQIIMKEEGAAPHPLALELAQGSVGKAISLSEPDLIEDVFGLLSVLPNIDHLSPKERFTLMQSLSTTTQFEPRIEMLILLIERASIAMETGQAAHLLETMPQNVMQPFSEWLNKTPLAERLKIRDKLTHTLYQGKAAHLDRLSLSDMVLCSLERRKVNATG